MYSFEDLSATFVQRFNTPHFPSQPASLYEPADYFLGIGGKRVRPVLLLMGDELFGDIHPDAWLLASGVAGCYNFTLIPDDIIYKAPPRRREATPQEHLGPP